MLFHFDLSAKPYAAAWSGLLLILASYLLSRTVFRWGLRQTVRVTRYEPPQRVSPSIAAALVENGRWERAFATAIVSLAAKGYVRILQQADWFSVERMRAADASVSPEESVILSSLFLPGVKSYSFDNRDSSTLFEAYRDFQSTAKEILTPELMSTHVVLRLAGLAFSVAVLEPTFLSSLGSGNTDFSALSFIFMCVLILQGAYCLVAALRIWPTTLIKLASLIPGSRRPRRRVNSDDAIPVLLTGSAIPGLAFLGVLTSSKFAVLAASALVLNALSGHLLSAPTAAGRRVLAELWSFREFLARADSDRLGRENAPGTTPNTLEPYMPYAVALSVEHGWGEEFAGNILELLEVDQAYGAFASFARLNRQPPW